MFRKGGGAYLVTGAGALFFDEMEVDGATNFFSFLSISERRLYTILYK